MRKVAALVVTLALAAIIAAPAHAITFNPDAIDRPLAIGDQLVFYYDARAAFTTFLNLHNNGRDGLDVQVLFYGPSFSSPFTRTYSLTAHGTLVIDVGALRSAEPALSAQFGAAIATAVNPESKPVVTRALSGNFTVANLLLHSAWGAAAAARSAVQGVDSTLPSSGTLIDGTTVRLAPIQPTSAQLAVYDNPDTLESPSTGGNQLIFVAFEDVPGERYAAQTGITTWSVAANRNNGVAIGPIPDFVASGVVVTDLASVATTAVNGASGSMTFEANTTPAFLSRFVFFTETLGTFATGYLLPPISVDLP